MRNFSPLYDGLGSIATDPVPTNVRCASNSDLSSHGSEMTRSAITGPEQSQQKGNSITSSAAASSLSGTVRPERLRGLQVDPDQLLRGSGTRISTEWGTVSFSQGEERHECHGGCRHNEECGRYFVACTFHQPSRHERRQAAEQA